jgi:hypothetical protein
VDLLQFYYVVSKAIFNLQFRNGMNVVTILAEARMMREVDFIRMVDSV